MRSDNAIHRPCLRGFTLVELVIVVMILGILAGVAAPRLLSVSSDAEASTLLTNVRTIFDAAQIYATQNGRLPVETLSGTPPDFGGLLPDRLFTEATGLGGPLDWNGPGTAAPTFGVSVLVSGTDQIASREVYKAMELAADDGTATGGWITIAAGRHVNFELASKAGGGAAPGLGSGG